jgi:hypothetical protein
MAETAGREPLARRASFRKSLAEAGLPQEYLDQLEQKRKQLDESIHKYIAAKDRDYRQFEKDLRTQYRASQTQIDVADAQQRRRASAEEAQQQAGDKSALSAVDTLLRKGLRRDSDNNVIEGDDVSTSTPNTTAAASLDERRTSDDRGGFVGVFTPQFLPALETESAQNRPDSLRAGHGRHRQRIQGCQHSDAASELGQRRGGTAGSSEATRSLAIVTTHFLVRLFRRWKARLGYEIFF